MTFIKLGAWIFAKLLSGMCLLNGFILGLPSIVERFRSSKKLPVIKDPILFRSATQLAKMIRNREVSSIQVVTAYVHRCVEVNPILNAIVQDRFHLALDEAKRVDEFIKTIPAAAEEMEAQYPLLGVPVTVKESISVAGMQHDCGVWKPVIIPATRDAQTVAQIKAAGGIPLLVSNCPELCTCPETFNYVTGRTSNPYNTTRTPGGSSGGEAALISSAASVIGIGTDAAGSLRIPASFCGIFSHKPSPRLVNNVDGSLPRADIEKTMDYAALGPMARYAEDLRLVTKVLQWSESVYPDIQLDKKVSLHDMRLFYLLDDKSWLSKKPDKDVINGMKNLINSLDRNLNIQIKEINIKCYKSMLIPVILKMLNTGVETIFGPPGTKVKVAAVMWELLKKITCCSKSIFSNILMGMIMVMMQKIPKGYYAKTEKKVDIFRDELKELLKDDGVLILPTFPNVANHHGGFYTSILNVNYLAIFNAAGFPATSFPVGFNSQGLPVGLQMVANPGCDHLLFSAAEEFEKTIGGWSPPPCLN